MKRNKILSVAMVIGMLTVASFSYAFKTSAPDEVVIEQEVSKTAVEIESLPDTVKETLKGDAFEGYEVGEAALIVEAEKTYYQIKLTKGDETKVVRINPDGEILK
jgi:hypothetical protein